LCDELSRRVRGRAGAFHPIGPGTLNSSRIEVTTPARPRQAERPPSSWSSKT
jgi:hypothetical protein